MVLQLFLLLNLDRGLFDFPHYLNGPANVIESQIKNFVVFIWDNKKKENIKVEILFFLFLKNKCVIFSKKISD